MVGLMRGTCDLFRLWSLGSFGEKLGVLCLPDGQARLFFGLQKANQLPAQFGQVAALSEEEAKLRMTKPSCPSVLQPAASQIMPA